MMRRALVLVFAAAALAACGQGSDSGSLGNDPSVVAPSGARQLEGGGMTQEDCDGMADGIVEVDAQLAEQERLLVSANDDLAAALAQPSPDTAQVKQLRQIQVNITARRDSLQTEKDAIERFLNGICRSLPANTP